MSVDDILQKSVELQQANRWQEALNFLTEENLKKQDHQLAKAIAAIRVSGFQHVSNSNSAETSWSPKKTHDFKIVNGIPEINSNALSSTVLAGSVLDHGSLIVRNLIPQEKTQQLVQSIDNAMQGRLEMATNKATTLTSWFDPPKDALNAYKLGAGRKFINETGGMWTIDSPMIMTELITIYQQLKLKELLTQYFNETPCLSVRKWVLRKSRPLPKEADWHQDGSFMGTDVRSINLWIALSDCGGDSNTTGIDIIPKRLNHIVETGTLGADFDWTVSPRLVEESFCDTPSVTPHFKAGDAIFFDHYNLHRTSYSEKLVNNRYAIETWFFASSYNSEKQIPIIF